MIQDNVHIFSDESIRRFLLGRLNASEQSHFEHSLFVDDTLEERVRLAELELSDDYAENRLSRSDRDLFHSRFLLTADRAWTLEISRVLHDNFASTARDTQAGFWQNALGIFDIRQNAWKYAFATFTLLLLLLGTALLIKRENSRSVKVSPPRVLPKPTAVQQPAHHPENSSAPTHNERSPVLPLHEGLATSIVLDSKTPLDSAPTISTSGDVITVQLKLDEPAAESYEVNVLTMAGESVFYANELKLADEKTLGFEVPANSLKSGDFQVTLTRNDGQSTQNKGIYYFRVR